jgi:hypothetical protein
MAYNLRQLQEKLPQSSFRAERDSTRHRQAPPFSIVGIEQMWTAPLPLLARGRSIQISLQPARWL